jgi:hypothetical protein
MHKAKVQNVSLCRRTMDIKKMYPGRLAGDQFQAVWFQILQEWVFDRHSSL